MTSLSQTSQRRNGFAASMSTTANAQYTFQMGNFLRQAGDLNERLLRHTLTANVHTIPNTPYNTPQSNLSVSSMTSAPIHQTHYASSSLPSLTKASTANSLSTIPTLTENLVSQTLLNEGSDDVLEQPIPPTTLGTHQCVFWFLSCDYSSHDYTEWKTHCNSHLRGQPPPSKVQCGMCQWAVTRDSGVAAWEEMLRHVSDTHFMSGHRLNERWRKDLYLYEWMWQKKLIGPEDLKALKSGNILDCRRFVETGKSSYRVRAQGSGRIPRGGREGTVLQHVTPR